MSVPLGGCTITTREKTSHNGKNPREQLKGMSYVHVLCYRLQCGVSMLVLISSVVYTCD